MSRLVIFAVAMLGFWVVAAVAARLLWNDLQAVYAGVAVALCGLPALASLGWIAASSSQSPQNQFVAVMGGTALRLMVVSATAGLLLTQIPFFRQAPGFAAWVLVAYLVTLGLEIVLAVKGRSFTGASREAAS